MYVILVKRNLKKIESLLYQKSNKLYCLKQYVILNKYAYRK